MKCIYVKKKKKKRKYNFFVGNDAIKVVTVFHRQPQKYVL